MSDAITRITAKHVVAGMHIGAMGDLHPTSIDSVLTVGATPGIVPDGIRHRHIALSYQVLDTDRLHEAVIWTLAQIEAERTVLIRSERGLQRPGLVAALVILRLGGRAYDAMSAVKSADIRALSDFRYTAIVKAEEQKILARTATQP